MESILRRGLYTVWEVIGVSDSAGAEASTPGFAEWSFPAEPGAVREARVAVRATLREWGLEPLAEVTALLVSELVTNSMRYTSGPIGVRMYFHHAAKDGSPVLLTEVSDPLPDPPQQREPTVDDEGGRGLRLVAGVSRRWGARRGKAGKTVWFELGLPGEESGERRSVCAGHPPKEGLERGLR